MFHSVLTCLFIYLLVYFSFIPLFIPCFCFALADKMTYPQKTFRKVHATVLATDIMGAAVRDVFTNDLFTLKTPFAEMIIKTARDIDDTTDGPSFQRFSEDTVGGMLRVANILRGKVWTDKVKTDMWQSFHHFRGSERTLKRWTNFLNELKIERHTDVEAFLLQHILEISFGSLLKTVMETDLPTANVDATPQPMDASEEQALRYCCGYVPFKLRKQYSRMKQNSVAAKFVTILSSWANNSEEDAESLLDYTERWLSMQNRGASLESAMKSFYFLQLLSMWSDEMFT